MVCTGINIVCTVEYLLHRVYCGKRTVIMCDVNNHLTLCVMWKTCSHRVYRQQTFDIVCTVENLLHRVYRKQLAVTVCIVNKHLTSGVL